MPDSSELQQLASSPLISSLAAVSETSTGCNKLVASTCQELESASKSNNRPSSAGRGRRKVLADLAGNDSPIVGLIPAALLNCAARTPASCDFKSALRTQNGASKRPFISHTDKASINNTPMGESLLRSQVKLLLQKVESNAPPVHRQAPSLRALCHLHSYVDSPALKLAAPTPINTPCSNISHNDHQAPTLGSSIISSDLVVSKHPHSVIFESNDRGLLALTDYFQEAEDQHQPADVQKVQESGIKLLVDLHISPEAEAEAEAAEPFDRLPLHSKASKGASHISITEFVLSGSDHHVMLQTTPLSSQNYFDVEADVLALGKKTTRTLQFDSPAKVSCTDQILRVSVPEMQERLCTSVRELQEDELSDWSILVNVSSPDLTGRRDVELDEEDSADSSNLQPLNQKTPAAVWKSSCRRGTPFPKGTFTGNDEVDDDEESLGGEIEAMEENGAETIKAEACSKGLPRAEGKHIKFSYNSDDEFIPCEPMQPF
ncbi:hypothetical protein L7F22_024777 [Adiantum nelumboides]|nr:hypothetical protein [Adiantum nelumboides]